MRRVGGRRDARQNMLGWLEWDGAVGCVCVFGGRIRESAWMSKGNVLLWVLATCNAAHTSLRAAAQA